MDKEKQIGEMVLALTESQHTFDRAWKECLHNNAPMPDRENVFYAKYLIEKEGYRKASEVAEEIFEEIEKWRPITKLVIKDIGEFDFDKYGEKFYWVSEAKLAELKKKYTESEDTE